MKKKNFFAIDLTSIWKIDVAFWEKERDGEGEGFYGLQMLQVLFTL